jgi:hypothetical protein
MLSRMKSMILELAVRIVGLIVTLWGLWHLADIPASLPGVFLEDNDWASTISYCLQSLIYGVPGATLGLILLLWGNTVAAWALGRSETTPPPLPPPKQ